MCIGVTNKAASRPIAQPSPQPASQPDTCGVNAAQAERNQDGMSCSETARSQSRAQQRIDRRENAMHTLASSDSCSLSRDQMAMALNGAGVGRHALEHASDAEVKQAYDQLRQAATTPGDHNVFLGLGGREYNANVSVASDGGITNLGAQRVRPGDNNNNAQAPTAQAEQNNNGVGGFLGGLLNAIGLGGLFGGNNGNGSSSSNGGNPISNLLGSLFGGGNPISNAIGSIFGGGSGGSNPISNAIGSIFGGGAGGNPISNAIGSIFGGGGGGGSNPISNAIGSIFGGGGNTTTAPTQTTTPAEDPVEQDPIDASPVDQSQFGNDFGDPAFSGGDFA